MLTDLQCKTSSVFLMINWAKAEASAQFVSNRQYSNDLHIHTKPANIHTVTNLTSNCVLLFNYFI